MAVMNPMGGGIDSAVTQRMHRMQNDPNALGQQAQKSGDILDLIAARRAADLVAEQKKLLALQMNGSPSTIKDQVGEELVASQKEQMKGPLQDLRGRTQGVGGVLENQQMQGAPTMAAAQGGIINAPAPNLTRMYNGGIVGYAGKEGSEVSSIDAYLKRLGIDPSRVKDATDAELVNIKAAVEFEMQKDRDKGAGLLAPPSDAFSALLGVPGSTESEAQRLDLADKAAARGRALQGEDVINPPTYDTNVREAERLRDLKSFGDKDYVDKGYYNVNDEKSLDSYVATMNDPKFGVSGEDQLNNTLSGYAEAAQQAAQQAGIVSALPEGNGGFSPVMTKKERGIQDLKNLGLDKKQEFDFEPFMRKPEVNPNQSPRMTPQQQAEARPKPKTPVELLQERLDKMDGKKGIAGLVERFANTDFQKSYGGTGEALAQAGRDIAKTGKDEKAAERKFLEDQLGVQQSIEAAQVSAAAEESRFGRGLAETQAARKQAGDEFSKKFTQLNTQFDDKLAQDGTYQSAKIEVDKRANEIRAITESNNTALLSANNKQQVFAILQTMRSDYDKMIAIEVENILARPGEDYAAKKAEADAHRETRNTEFANLQSSLVGTLRGGSGGSGGGSSAKAAASKILGT